MASRARKSVLTPAEARWLREQAGLSPQEWADLLNCSVQSVYNMESEGSQTAIGKQMARLMVYMGCTPMRLLAAHAIQEAEAALAVRAKNTP